MQTLSGDLHHHLDELHHEDPLLHHVKFYYGMAAQAAKVDQHTAILLHLQLLTRVIVIKDFEDHHYKKCDLCHKYYTATFFIMCR